MESVKTMLAIAVPIGVAFFLISEYSRLQTVAKSLRKSQESRKSSQSSTTFDRACHYVRTHEFSGFLQLKFYGLFKQAVEGDAPDTSVGPSPIDAAKRKAWERNRGMRNFQAAALYVDLLTKEMPHWKDEINDEPLEPTTPNQNSSPSIGPVMSRPALSNGNTPKRQSPVEVFLDSVRNNKGEEVRAFLIAKPEYFRICDDQGHTALHLAADRGHLQLTKLLVRGGADVNAVNSDGDTPLHLALVSENPKVAKFLMEHNANMEISNANGETPLTLYKKP
jgi:acyl-CoA-binding protein